MSSLTVTQICGLGRETGLVWIEDGFFYPYSVSGQQTGQCVSSGVLFLSSSVFRIKYSASTNSATCSVNLSPMSFRTRGQGLTACPWPGSFPSVIGRAQPDRRNETGLVLYTRPDDPVGILPGTKSYTRPSSHRDDLAGGQHVRNMAVSSSERP